MSDSEAIRGADAFFHRTMPAPALVTDRPTIGCSNSGCIGITMSGSPWARAGKVVECPP